MHARFAFFADLSVAAIDDNDDDDDDDDDRDHEEKKKNKQCSRVLPPMTTRTSKTSIQRFGHTSSEKYDGARHLADG